MRILSLCSGSGSFEKPWLDNGRYVLSLTLPFEDVRLIKFEPKGFDGILCAPPCRCFTQTASSMPNSITEKIDAISVVDACLRAVLLYRPKFWVLENPPGSLKDYIGPCSFSFQPWWYGDLSQKYTNLWGEFKVPARTVLKKPEKLTDTSSIGRSGDARRAITPPGFAYAFYLANQERLIPGAVSPGSG